MEEEGRETEGGELKTQEPDGEVERTPIKYMGTCVAVIFLPVTEWEAGKVIQTFGPH